MRSSKGCTTASVPVICQLVLGFLFCWETAVSLTAWCTGVYNINSASGGSGRLKHPVRCDDLGDGEEVNDQRDLDEMVWWWHFGYQTLLTLPSLAVQLEPSEVNSPLAMLLLHQSNLKVTLVGKLKCRCWWKAGIIVTVAFTFQLPLTLNVSLNSHDLRMYYSQKTTVFPARKLVMPSKRHICLLEQEQ